MLCSASLFPSFSRPFALPVALPFALPPLLPLFRPLCSSRFPRDFLKISYEPCANTTFAVEVAPLACRALSLPFSLLPLAPPLPLALARALPLSRVCTLTRRAFDFCAQSHVRFQEAAAGLRGETMGINAVAWWRSVAAALVLLAAVAAVGTHAQCQVSAGGLVFDLSKANNGK